MKVDCIVAALTALNEDNTIDFESNNKLYKRLINAGVNGILLLGTTGEFPGLCLDDKKKLLENAVSCIGDKVRILAGCGSNSLKDTIALSQYAESIGIKELMIICPSYFKLVDDDIYSYYDYVASSVHSDIYIYNYPDFTGCDVNPDIVLRLLNKHKNIKGYKDTVLEINHTLSLITRVHAHYPAFKVYSGFEIHFAANALCGGAGMISGIGNICPELICKAADSLRYDDLCEISIMQKRLSICNDLYGISQPFIPAAKYLLKNSGVISSDKCTEPIGKLSPTQKGLCDKMSTIFSEISCKL